MEEKKNRSYWKILRDINHTLNNNSYWGKQTSLKFSEWFSLMTLSVAATNPAAK